MGGVLELRGDLTDGQAQQYVEHYTQMHSENPERRALERLWFINKAYYGGAHHMVMDDGRIRVPRRRTKNREYFSANRTLPKVLKAVARLLAVNADFTVSPMSGAYEDLMAAKTASKVWEHLRQETKFTKQLRRALIEAAMCGSAFLKVTFDPMKGKPERIWIGADGHATLQPMVDPELRQALEQAGKFEDAYPGEVKIDVVTPFQTFWDPNARAGGIDDCAWMAQITYAPIEDLMDRYPGMQFTGDEHNRAAQLYEDNIANLVSGLQGHLGIGLRHQSQVGMRTQVVEYWERPLPRNEMKGRLIVIAGKRLLRNEANPYAAAGIGLPWVKIDWFPYEGRFMGVSLVEQLRPSQKAYNRARSHAIEYQKTYGYAPVFLPKDSSITAKNMMSMPGVIYEYEGTSGTVPTFGQTPNMPDSVAYNTIVAKEEMDELSAQTSPSKDAFPAGIRSGAAISLLQQDNNAILTPTSQGMMEAVGELGTMALKLTGLFYDTPRVMAVAGQVGDIDVTKFVGTDLRGHYELKMRGEPTVLESAESYKQTVLDALQVGAIDPQNDRRHRALVMKAFRFGEAEQILDNETRQEIAEERMIDRMVREPDFLPRLLPWEDPITRVPVLEHYLNSREFELLSDIVKRKIAARWSEMKNVLAQQMQAQMEAVSQARGGPGEKGQPSQPNNRPAQVSVA